MLNTTPPDRMLDEQGRPYFLWDGDLTLADFLARLEDPERDVRAYWIGKLMRQANPDDVFQFVTRQRIDEHWDLVQRHLGQTREFWTWVLATWHGSETCLVDLVSEAGPALAAPDRVSLGDREIAIDSPHEILVNKLCALLGRPEIRDLVDLRALLESGGDLERAVADAPRRDGGFSTLTLAWVLRGLRLEQLSRSEGMDAASSAALSTFRDVFIRRLTAGSRP